MDNFLQNPLANVMDATTTTIRDIAHKKGLRYYCTVDCETDGLYHKIDNHEHPVYYQHKIGNDYIVAIATHYEFHPVMTTASKQCSYGINIVISKNNPKTKLGEINIEVNKYGQANIEIKRKTADTEMLYPCMVWNNVHISTKGIAMIASSTINAFVEGIPIDKFIYQDMTSSPLNIENV